MATVGDFRPCSYADNVGREVPARRASSSWVRPERSRMLSSSSAASIIYVVYPMRYVSDRILRRPRQSDSAYRPGRSIRESILRCAVIPCRVDLKTSIKATAQTPPRQVRRAAHGWLAPYAPPASWASGHIPLGRAGTYGDGTDITIATFGNGVRMSMRAAVRLQGEGISCRVVDLRWLAPLPVGDLLREASVTGRVLIADETRRTGGVSEGIIAALTDAGFTGRVRRVASEDSFIPLGEAAASVLLTEAAIEGAAWDILH